MNVRHLVLRTATWACGLALATAMALPALAGQFSPIKYVNGLAITQYEFDQRVLFMSLLGQPGNLEEQALTGLIDDRIKQGIARAYEFKVPDDVLRQAMDEFASQANMNADQFIQALGKGGVDAQTFRDFVESGMIWREIVRGKIGPTVKISDAEIDRALSGQQGLAAKSVRLAEIVLPATGANRGPALAQAHHIELELRAGAPFSEMVRKYSKGPNAGSGGVTDWKLLSQMAPDAAVAVRALAPEAVSEPVVLDDSVVIYQMLEIKDIELPPPGTRVVDYAELLLPDDPKLIAKVRNTADTCDELAGKANSVPNNGFQRQTVPIGQLSPDIAGALVTLDPGESSTVLARGNSRVFLMLCRRGELETDLPTRDEVRIQLSNQRLGALADIYLEELRRDALIIDP